MRVRTLCHRSITGATVSILLTGPNTVMAQVEHQKAVKFAAFDHLNTNGDRAYELQLTHGESFQIQILNTCPEVFAYEVHGIIRQEAGTGITGKTALALEPKHVVPVLHDAKYGGYIVTIRRTVATGNPCGDDTAKLRDRTLMISTPQLTWDLSFSGGFTVSNLTSSNFYLRPHPTDTTKKQILEDPDKNDDATLGLASFVHLYHHRRPWLAGMFGLGLRDNNKTEYYLGGGLRFSDKATLNVGVVWGPVTRLKNGNNPMDATADDNVLTDLPTRTKRGVFVGLSYSFIDVRGKLQQPFAGATGAAGTTETTSTSAPAAASTPEVCTATIDRPEVTLASTAKSTTTAHVTVKPEGCAWKVTDGIPTWATVVPADGKGDTTLTITASEANATPNDRTAKVDISGAVLTIRQPRQ
jgi:hypothetical protein